MNLFNKNTGEYFTPCAETLLKFKQGKRPFLQLLYSDMINRPEEVEREFKIVKDIRKETSNERFVIYEIAANTFYVLIHKKDGNILKISAAQNIIALLLKNIPQS